MHARHAGIKHIGRRLLVLLLIAGSTMLLSAPAQAATLTSHAAYSPHAAPDTVVLSLDNAGTNFIYGGMPVPTFTAVVTFGTKPAANYFWTLSGKLDSGQAFGSSSPTTSQDGMTMTFAHMPVSAPIPTGQRTAVATFFDPGTNATATSNSVSLTINKATAGLSCGIDGNAFRFEGAGQTLHIRMSPSPSNSQAPVDWQDGTYAVTFDGPTHLAYPNLTPDSNDEVTVTAPAPIGIYQMDCTFSGTALFTSADSGDTPYTFSALQPLGSVQLFTNPTTLAANQNLEFYFVFHPGPGLPAPTGEFSIYIGPYYSTSTIKLNSSGDALVQLSPLPSLSGVSKISVQYYGDVEYNVAWVYFPLTNPPIPNGGGSGGQGGSGGGSSGNNASATPTAGGTANAQGTATATAGAVPTAAGPGVLGTSAPSLPGNNGVLILIVLLVLLILVGFGAVGSVLYLRRRAKRNRDAGNQTPPGAPSGAPPDQSPVLSEETIPVPRHDG